MKKKITLNDNLKEIVQRTINNVTEVLEDFVSQNPRLVSKGGEIKTPCLDTDLDYSGTIHQIVDQAVPIYDKEIKDLWYLYDAEFEKAYENAGVGDKTGENWKGAAIYFYIYERLRDWYEEKAPEITRKTYKKNISAELKRKIDKMSEDKILNL